MLEGVVWDWSWEKLLSRGRVSEEKHSPARADRDRQLGGNCRDLLGLTGVDFDQTTVTAELLLTLGWDLEYPLMAGVDWGCQLGPEIASLWGGISLSSGTANVKRANYSPASALEIHKDITTSLDAWRDTQGSYNI